MAEGSPKQHHARLLPGLSQGPSAHQRHIPTKHRRAEGLDPRWEPQPSTPKEGMPCPSPSQDCSRRHIIAVVQCDSSGAALQIVLLAAYQQLRTLPEGSYWADQMPGYGCWRYPLDTCLYILTHEAPPCPAGGSREGGWCCSCLHGCIRCLGMWCKGVLCVCLPAGNTSLPLCWLDSGAGLSYHILKFLYESFRLVTNHLM